MTRFVARRAAQAVLVLLVATLAIFLATFALGDPFASRSFTSVTFSENAESRIA